MRRMAAVPGAGRRGGPGPSSAWAALVVAGLTTALLAVPSGPTAGQDDQDKAPRIPAGTPVVLAPVQSVRPAPGGSWPGGADSREAALEHINAEVDFAVSEEPMASAWASPGTVVDRADRNPMLKVRPRQLAYRGLLVESEPEFLYDPLHTQLRNLTALLDGRLVILPLAVWYESGPRTGAGGGAGGDAGRSAAPADSTGPRVPGRAVMRVALVDARRGSVLWTGDVSGADAPPDSPATVATLAANLVDMLTQS